MNKSFNFAISLLCIVVLQACASPQAVARPSATPTDIPATVANPASLPTLTPKETDEMVLSLMLDNGGCELPCFWGMIPGETTWKSGEQFLKGIASRMSDYGEWKGADFPFNTNEGVASEIGLGLLIDDQDVIDLIHITNVKGITDPDFSLLGVFSSFGPPDEIKISVEMETPVGPAVFYYLEYPSIGLLIHGWGFGVEDGQFLSYCLTDLEWDPEVWMWAPASNYSFEKLLPPADSPDSYFSIEELSDLNIIEFYNQVIGTDKNSCILLEKLVLE